MLTPVLIRNYTCVCVYRYIYTHIYVYIHINYFSHCMNIFLWVQKEMLKGLYYKIVISQSRIQPNFQNS